MNLELRDAFAASAISGIAEWFRGRKDQEGEFSSVAAEIASAAYLLADAMLEERERLPAAYRTKTDIVRETATCLDAPPERGLAPALTRPPTIPAVKDEIANDLIDEIANDLIRDAGYTLPAEAIATPVHNAPFFATVLGRDGEPMGYAFSESAVLIDLQGTPVQDTRKLSRLSNDNMGYRAFSSLNGIRDYIAREESDGRVLRLKMIHPYTFAEPARPDARALQCNAVTEDEATLFQKIV